MTDQQIRDTRNPGHYWADNEIVDDYLPEIGVYGFAVYMLLCRFARGGHSKVSIPTIAKKLSISEPTVRKAITGLIKAKLIDANEVDHTAKTYDLLDVKSQKRTQSGLGVGVNDVEGGAKPDLGLGLNPVDPHNTKTIKTSKTETTDSPQPAIAVADAPPSDPAVKRLNDETLTPLVNALELEKEKVPPKRKGSNTPDNPVVWLGGVRYVGPFKSLAAARRFAAGQGTITDQSTIPAGVTAEAAPVEGKKPKVDGKPWSPLTTAMHEAIPVQVRPARCHYGKQDADAKAVYLLGYLPSTVAEYVKWAYANDRYINGVMDGGRIKAIWMGYVADHIGEWKASLTNGTATSRAVLERTIDNDDWSATNKRWGY